MGTRPPGIRTPSRAAGGSRPPAPRRAGQGGKAAPAGRARGRPPRSAPDQEQRLIDAALACYVRQGIGATRIRDIASEAGVTPAMVHYYFGGARPLLDRVIAERLMPVFGAVREAILGTESADPLELATRFVDAVFAVVERHPWWPALWVREVLSEGGALRDLLVARVAPDLARRIVQRFAYAQREGLMNPGLDPRLVMVTLIGLTLFPAAGAPIWQRIFGEGRLTMDDVRRHALALLAAGFKGVA